MIIFRTDSINLANLANGFQRFRRDDICSRFFNFLSFTAFY